MITLLFNFFKDEVLSISIFAVFAIFRFGNFTFSQASCFLGNFLIVSRDMLAYLLASADPKQAKANIFESFFGVWDVGVEWDRHC